MTDELTVLTAGPARAQFSPTSAALRGVQLPDTGTEFITDPDRRGGLLRMAVPLPGRAGHWLELGTQATPTVTEHAEEMRLVYDGLVSEHVELDVRVEVNLRPCEQGLVLRARVHNSSEYQIPQLAFPQLLGLHPLAEPADTRLQLPGRRMQPFVELAMRPDDVTFLQYPLQEYIWYGSLDFTMKWLDYGDPGRGLTLYSCSPRYTTQGLLVERPDRGRNTIDLRWVHYPFIEPGESWDSDDFILVPHTGDWYAGARAYQQFAAARYPYNAPRRVREALAIRSVWPAVRNSDDITFTFLELPAYAEEVADPQLGITELVLWHWWLKNGYPIIVDERLGTEDELRSAIAQCAEIGVPVALFVSHHILRDTKETDPAWVHLNAAGQPTVWDWTYGPGFLPKFRPSFHATHSMIKGSALSPGWRETGLAEYRRIVGRGADGICFDVYYAWGDPNFNPSADGRRDEEGEKLLEFGREARRIVHERKPEGSFSGEWPSDLKVPVIDYTWDWRNSFDVAEAAPFRYVFPHFRLNANVGAQPRGAMLGFMEGALLNVMPGNMRTERLSAHPELVTTLRRLNRLRRRFLPYFTNGQYHHLEGVAAVGCEARLYSHHGDLLVVTVNPSETPVQANVYLDPRQLGLSDSAWKMTRHALDGGAQPSEAVQLPGEIEVRLGGDDLAVLELRRSP